MASRVGFAACDWEVENADSPNNEMQRKRRVLAVIIDLIGKPSEGVVVRRFY